MRAFFQIASACVILSFSRFSFAGDYELANLISKSRTDARAKTSFQNAATMNLTFLISKGVSTIGPYKLTMLVDQFKNVHWRFTNPNVEINAGPDGDRHSAIYSVKDKMVIVSLENWNRQMVSQRPLLAIHESLSALGYDDTRYQLTSLIGAAAAVTNVRISPEPNGAVRDLINSVEGVRPLAEHSAVVQARPRLTTTPIFQRAGGITGIGGGGDGDTVLLKTDIVMGAMASRSALPESAFLPSWNFQSFLEAIINCELEEDDNVKATLDPNFNFKMTKVTRTDDQLRIVIPVGTVSLLSAGNPNSNELAAYMRQLASEIARHFVK